VFATTQGAVLFPAAALRRGRPDLLTRRPELLPVAVTALAWAVLVLNSASGSAGHHHHAGAALPDAAHTTAMVVATMGLLAVPGARSVAARRAWWCGRSAVVLYVGVFLTTWVAVAFVLGLAAPALTAVLPSGAATAAVLTGAALAHCHPRRSRWVQECAQSIRIRARGPGGLRDAMRYGVLSAGRCARVCALPMSAMLLAPGLLVMAAVAALTLLERMIGRPRPAWFAPAYGLLAVAVLAGAA
jgi:hypothetical protein